MAAYPTAPLRDVCAHVEYGYTASSTPDSSVGPRFLRITDIVPERLDWESVPFCAIEPKKLAKHRLRTGDIVIARTGATTGWAKYIKDPPEAVFASYLVRVRPASTVDARYIGFVVESSVYKDFIQQHMGGAAQPNANAQVLTSFEVPLPPLPIQQRIAGILSAYDELIENSQRRIKILESMARALYREWFVHFRFPGHESVPRVPSSLGEIPQGWTVKKLEEIITDHIGGGWGKEEPDHEHTEPAWVIRGTDIPSARYSQLTNVPHRVHTVSNLRARRLHAGDIVFEVSGGSKGQPVGRTLLITSELLTSLEGDVICASFCKRIRPDIDGYGSELLYLSFLEGYESGEIEQYQVQSTGISNFKWTEYIANTVRVIPPHALRLEFYRQVSPLLSQIAVLGKKIQNLRRTRDLLLPRLLSGQIDVESLQ
jgi:type I restriction enzyme, S subunit